MARRFKFRKMSVQSVGRRNRKVRRRNRIKRREKQKSRKKRKKKRRGRKRTRGLKSLNLRKRLKAKFGKKLISGITRKPRPGSIRNRFRNRKRSRRERIKIVASPAKLPDKEKRRKNRGYRKFFKAKTSTKYQKAKNLKEDKLKLSNLVLDGSNNLINEFTNGITEQRPEIISLMKARSIYTGSPKQTQFNDYGQLMEVNYQTRLMQDEIIKKFLDNMIDSFQESDKIDNEAEKSFLRLKSRRLKEINVLANTLSLYTSLDSATSKLRTKMNPKKIRSKHYKTNNYYAIKEFFINKMQFSEDQWKRFTGTKVYLQLLSDYRFASTHYSYNLFGQKDADRKNNFSPVELDKTYNRAFRFKMELFESKDRLKLASVDEFFRKFMRALPATSDDRLILLFHYFGKELTVSKKLDDPKTKEYRNFFGFENFGNPFENILGRPGDNIFEPIFGENSLSSLAQISFPSNENLKILPFEDKVVDVGETEITYLPGWEYYSDTLYKIKNESNPRFHKNDFRRFVDTFSNINNKGIQALDHLLSLNEKTKTEPAELYKLFLSFYVQSISEMRDIYKASSVDQPLLSSLFNLANTDTLLKKQLFEFCLLAGLAEEQRSKQKTTIFNRLAIEYDSLKNFQTISEEAAGAEVLGQNVSLVNNPKLDYSTWGYLIARKISNRVYRLLRTNKKGLNTKEITKLVSQQENNQIENSLVLKDSNSNGGHSLKFTNFDSFFEKLKQLFDTTSGSSINFTLLKSFVETARNISKISVSSEENPGNWLIQGKSRFNQLSVSTQMLFIFEIISSMTKSFSFSEFKSSSDKKTIEINYNSYATAYMHKIISSIVSNGFNVEAIGSYKPEKKKTKYTKKSNSNIRRSTTASARNKILKMPLLSRFKKSRLNGIDVNVHGNDPNFTGKIVSNTSNGHSLDLNSPSLNSTIGSWFGSRGMTNWRGHSLNKIPLSSFDIKINIPTNFGISFSSPKWTVPSYGNTGGSFLSKKSAASRFVFNPFLNPKNLNTDISEVLFSRIKSELVAMGQKMEAEEAVLSNINYLLKVIRTRINEGMDLVDREFNNDKLNLIIDKSIQLRKTDTSLVTFDALRNLKNPAQLQTSVYTYLSYKDKFARQSGEDLNEYDNKENRFLASESINVFERDALYKYAEVFSKPSERNIYILSVGLPRKFINFLQDRTQIDSVDDIENKPALLKQKQSDIIKINVYKRLLRYPDIVFKPQSFYFDASLFVLPEDLRIAQINDKTGLSQIYNKSQVSDLSILRNAEEFKIDNFKPRKISTQKIVDLIQYKNIGLNNNNKREMIINHINSHLLSLYIQMSTGIKLTEDVFLTKKVAETGLYRTYVNTIISYLRDVLEEPIPKEIEGRRVVGPRDILDNPDVSDESKDLLNVVIRGNVFYQQGFLTNKILGPKVFDRIFHLPVNMDNFAVDSELTNSTLAGKQAFNQANNQGLFVQNSSGEFIFTGRSVSKDNDQSDDSEVIFDDLFVNIESIL